MHNVQTGATMNDNSNRPPNDYDRPVNGNGQTKKRNGPTRQQKSARSTPNCLIRQRS